MHQYPISSPRRLIAFLWLGGMILLASGVAYLGYVYLWPATTQPVETLPELAVPTRLVIPNLALEAPIVTVGWETVRDGLETETRWQSPGSNVGFAINSAPPIEGMGNTVLIGHNNILGEVFKELDQLSTGDRIAIYTDEELNMFAVSEVILLQQLNADADERLRHTEYLAPTDSPRLTLVSCWPYEVNTYRVIVIAEPVNS